MFRKALAEFIGTLALVFFGAGAAMTNGFGIGLVGIALAFGLVIVAMAYSMGAVSGGHFNPAVSFAMWLDGRISGAKLLEYIFAQFAGALVGAWLLHVLFGRLGNLGTNSYGAGRPFNLSTGQAFLLEVLLTLFFVLTVLGVTSKKHKNGAVAGIVIGLALALVHLLGLPLTGTSVNPARSFGPALLFGGTPWRQLWLFILAPLVGAAIAAGIWRLLGHHHFKQADPVELAAGYAPRTYVTETEYVATPAQVTYLREPVDGNYRPDIAG
jgi:aquaporin Z